MQDPPGQDARRIVQSEVARDEKQQARNDETVEARRGPRNGRSRRSYLSPGGRGSTRAPHEQTMLRVAHWMLSRRPHLPQPR